MIFLQWREEGEKIIVLLVKEIRSLQTVNQGEAIKPVPGAPMFSVYRGVRNFSSLSSLWKVLFL